MIEYLIGIHADGKQVAGEASRVSRSLGDIDNYASRIGARLGALFGAQQVVSFARSIVDFGGQIKDASTKTGISTDSIQAFKFAVEQSGGTLADVTGGIRFLSRAMAEAAETGKGDAVDAFRRFGITLEDVRRSSPEQVFLRLAAALGKMPASARVTVDAMALLGRGADDLFPAFRDGFAETASAAMRVGVVVERDVVEKLDNAGDTLDRIMAKLRAIGAKGLGESNVDRQMLLAEDFLTSFATRFSKLSSGQKPVFFAPALFGAAAETGGRALLTTIEKLQIGTNIALAQILVELREMKSAAKDVF